MNIRFASRDLNAPADLLVFGVGEDLAAGLAELESRFGSSLQAHAARRKFDGKSGSSLQVSPMGALGAAELLLVGLGSGSADDLWKAAGTAGRTARSLGAERVILDLAGDARLIAEAFAIGNYSYDHHKPESERKAATSELVFVGEAGAPNESASASIRIQAQAWARDLVNHPPADLYPETLAQEAVDHLANLPHTDVTVWREADLVAHRCVGVIAVGQGSNRGPRLIHIKYRPPGATAHVCLVGKGVTFDSGGYSLKPSPSMLTMKCDMAGAATVLAATEAAIREGAKVNIDTFVGAVENLVNGEAYKLGDVLKYDNGVTVEIHNTDAEGRLVLADCLIQASRVQGATHIIDVATLTGACVIATGPDLSGLFTADDAFANELLGLAAAQHDGLWRLPLHQPYKSMLKSDVAQLKNVGGRDAGATTAALFLQHFVDGKTWAHIDIAGPSFMDSPRGAYAAGGTGELVRTLAEWLVSKANG